jgi:hypothetical protein
VIVVVVKIRIENYSALKVGELRDVMLRNLAY